MDFLPSVEREFDAGHWVEGDPFCSNPEHGHRFKVRAQFRAHYDAQIGQSMERAAMDRALGDLIGRIEGRPIHKVLTGVRSTPEGLALWFMDQLLTSFAEVIAVTVWLDSSHAYEVRREIR
jgi:6-pyruvoyl-tetrahydropterin synthase